MGVEAKICGVTRPEDAALAVAHGAWRVGTIFAGGPRLIDVARAAEIVAAAGEVPVFGVFGSDPVESILERASAAGLAGIQLHGASTPAMAAALRAAGFEVWRVLTVDAGTSLAEAVAEGAREADALLVEPRLPGGSGGKGVALDLALARRAREAATGIRFVLAGGLSPETVAEAIRLVGPDVVDVSSGVESAPGRKDPARLIRFLETVRDARSAA